MKPVPCVSWDDTPARIKVEILRILGPRVPILDHVPDVPPTHGYVFLVLFGALWRRGDRRFAYIGKKSEKADLYYRGSGRRGEFQRALEECPPQDTYKVFLGVYPRGRQLSRMEFAFQKRVGIPEAGVSDDIDHDVWLNRYAYGGDKWQHQTYEQRRATCRMLAERERTDPEFRANQQARRSATCKMLAERERTDPEFRAKQQAARRATFKIIGKITGKITGPAAAENMFRRQATLIASHDPRHWDDLPYPVVQIPPGWEQNKNAARSGFDIPDDALIVPVARPYQTFSNSKAAGIMDLIYRRATPPTLDQHRDEFRQFCVDHGFYVGRAAAALRRNARKGLFAVVHNGAVILGPGGPESPQHDPRLTWSPERGWMRGRLLSGGPYGYPFWLAR